MGWLPAGEIGDPVIWHRRSFNIIADYITNHTMEVKRSWYQRFQPQVQDLDLRHANILVHSDGGARARQCSAAAWYVEARVEKDGSVTTFPLVMAGTFIEQPISSFKAEAIALDEAVDFITKLLQNLWSGGDPARLKRRRVTGPFS